MAAQLRPGGVVNSSPEGYAVAEANGVLVALDGLTPGCGPKARRELVRGIQDSIKRPG